MAKGPCFFPSPLQEETAQKERQQLRDVQRQVALESKVCLPVLEPPLFSPVPFPSFLLPPLPNAPPFVHLISSGHSGYSTNGTTVADPTGNLGVEPWWEDTVT